MIRRSLAAVVVSACVLPSNISGHANTLPELPRLNCTKRIVDAANDGYTNPTGVKELNRVETSGLDILSVFMRTTPDAVQMFAKIRSIPSNTSMPAYDVAYRYTFTFKHGPQVFLTEVLHANKNFESRFASRIYPYVNPSMTQKLEGGVDQAGGWAWVSVPRAAIEEKAAGTPLTTGGKIEALYAKSEWTRGTAPTDGALGDEVAPKGDDATFVVDDDFCFGPPPGTVSDLTASAAQWGDAVALRAKLVDEGGAAVANETVRFKVGNAAPVPATTDANGVATATYVADQVAGTYPVVAEFGGNTTVGKASTSGTVVLRPEVTKFAALKVQKPSTTKRLVTATLLDDEGKPVVGQRVAWYANGKLAGTLTTNSAGNTVFVAKPTQSVQARFAGVTGKYVGASSATKKV